MPRRNDRAVRSGSRRPIKALAWLPITAVALGGGMIAPAAADDGLRPTATVAASDSFSPETFESPRADSLPAVYWYWGGEITNELITTQMEQLRSKGIFEVVLFSFNGDDMRPVFGSEAWFDRVEHTLREAEEHGMKVWLFNDNNFPSGRGATLVTDGGTMGNRTWEASDEHRLKGLWRSTAAVTGGQEVSLSRSTGVTTESGRLAVDGQVLDGGAPLTVGADWSDYTFTAEDIRLAGESGGLMVRSSADARSGYLWEVDDRGVMILSRMDDGEKTVLTTGPSIPGFTFRRPRTLEIEVQGNTITAEIDGRNVISATDDTYSTGTVAPYNTDKDRTLWGEMAVADADGAALWSADFEDSSALGDFEPTMALEQDALAAVARSVDGDEQIELTANLDDGGTWQAPEGEWQLDVFGSMVLRNDDSGYTRGYLDLLSANATRAFLDTVPQEYVDRFEWAMGTVVPGFWDDEPFISSASPHPFKRQPWSPELAAEIEKLGGEPGKVFAASYEDIGRQSEIDRGLYWEAVSNLFANSYYKVQSEWMQEHDLKFISNPLLDEESPSHRLNSTADLTKINQWAQVPGTDMITGDYQLGEQSSLVRNAASNAHQQGKERVVLETFGNSGWQVAPEFMHATTGALATRGANQTFLHALWTDEKRVIFAPPFGPRSTFWHEMKPMDEWIGRVSEIARATDAADTALIQPQEAAQQFKGSEGGDNVDEQFNETGYALERSQVDFDYVTDGALSGDPAVRIHAEAPNGQLVVGEASYSHAVLPQTPTIEIEAIEMLDSFVRSGGELVVVGDAPTHEARGDDDALAAALENLLPDGNGTEAVGEGTVIRVGTYEEAGTAAAELGASAVSASPETPSLRVSRKVAGDDIAFLMNNESGDPIETTLTFPVSGVPELWDPVDGSTDRITNYTYDAESTSVPVELDAYETVAVVFPDGSEHGAHLTSSDLDEARFTAADGTIVVEALADAPGNYPIVVKSGEDEYTAETVVDDELAAIPVEGAWQFEFLPDQSPVEFSPGPAIGEEGLQVGEKVDTELGSWVDLNPTFSGTGLYSKTITVDAADLENRRMQLDLGEVHDLASVRVNGTDFPPALWSPYVVDVTDALVEGENSIEIEVTNTLSNERNKPLDSGLFGPVVLQPEAMVTVTLETGAGDGGGSDGGGSDGGDADSGSDDGSSDEGAGDAEAGDADGDLAVTGGSIALGAIVLALILAAGGALMVRHRRKTALIGGEEVS